MLDLSLAEGSSLEDFIPYQLVVEKNEVHEFESSFACQALKRPREGDIFGHNALEIKS